MPPEAASPPEVQPGGPWLVGIDLGTSHTVVAFAPRTQDAESEIELLNIPQWVRPGEARALPLFPSVRYHPAGPEVEPREVHPPWESVETRDDAGQDAVHGLRARQLGAAVPGRLVRSAKSWLSVQGAERTAPLLPPEAPEGVSRISPLEASAGYLDYIRRAWDQARPEAPLRDQTLVLTVPASFDAAARQLTLEAARQAGLERVALLEEPQAVCYDWLWRSRQGFAVPERAMRLMLVVDLGGGTLDFSLIAIQSEGQEVPRFTRIAVGPHLMLGGDNLDLALAASVETVLSEQGVSISSRERDGLIEAAREAKEVLLGEDAPEHYTLTLLGQGGRLISNARSVSLQREAVVESLIEGFFPRVSLDEKPSARRSGLIEGGLPYAHDPRITVHLADFLQRHQPAIREALGGTEAILPDVLLLNGGALKSPRIRQRLSDQLGLWGASNLWVLDNPGPDTAVAQGAVAFAKAREGLVLRRIDGGVARTLFLLVDGVSEDGLERSAFCLLPRGTAEGQSVELRTHRFLLQLGTKVSILLAEALDDARPEPGSLLSLAPGSHRVLPPMTLELSADQEGCLEREVSLIARLSEIGTLEVDCVATDASSRRWHIEFDLRSPAPGPSPVASHSDHPQRETAILMIREVFGPKSKSVDPKAVRRLRSELERLLGVRESWDIPLLRTLAPVLMEGIGSRRRSLDHERVWLNLTGYCLRPGFGHVEDAGHLALLISLFKAGPQFAQESQIWSEWWTLWRRVAGGLGAEFQLTLFEAIRPALDPALLRASSMAAQAKKRAPDDLIRLAAVLERLPIDIKCQLVEWLIRRGERPGEPQSIWWAIGRIGARKPWSGSLEQVIPSATLLPWVEHLLAMPLKEKPDVALALTFMARCTGEASLDLAPSVRQGVVKALAAAKMPMSWQTLVSSVSRLTEADERRLVGEALPPGLRLLRGESAEQG